MNKQLRFPQIAYDGVLEPQALQASQTDLRELLEESLLSQEGFRAHQ